MTEYSSKVTQQYIDPSEFTGMYILLRDLNYRYLVLLFLASGMG
jgi:hypothetical protein